MYDKKVVTVRIDEEIANMLIEIKAGRTITDSWIFRAALKEYYSNRKAKAAALAPTAASTSETSPELQESSEGV